MDNITLENIGALAVESMLYEVSATPKPGLVDRNNNGAHHDMNFFTFMSSAAALRNTFDNFAMAGYDFSRTNTTANGLLKNLMPIGVIAEKQMFAMTKNVNTHKGMIFSLGVLAGAAGFLWGKESKINADSLSDTAKEICKGICDSAYGSLTERMKKNPEYKLTKGEAMYLQYGVKGVRGEAEDGFPSVLNIALSEYKRLRQKGYDVNDTLVGTLIALLSQAGDTNILGRHNMETLLKVKKMAKQVLDFGSVETKEGKESIELLDKMFIQDYISPGGSADLIAVTHFIYSLEN